jgi:L-lactate dehydrogenase complex protein LldG
MAKRELIQRFLSALAALNGTCVVADGPDDAVRAVLEALQARDIREVVAWADPLFAEIGLAQAALRAGIAWFEAGPEADPAAVRRMAAQAGAGVTGSDWGVAETGTLALLHGPGRPRSASLLPPVHIALLPKERLLPDMAALFRQLSTLAAQGEFPASLQLVTGPSRSADIEDMLVRKVHGPGEVVVVLL